MSERLDANSLTPQQREVLRALEGQGMTSENDGPKEFVWSRPMDLGGRDASHHSKTLHTLVKLGMAEKKKRYAGISTGSYLYRLTAKGFRAYSFRQRYPDGQE